MNFYEIIKEISENKKTTIYVDMDGVIACYDFGKPLDFINKRPLLSNIKTLERLATLSNVELHILSVCRLNSQIKEKNDWLDKFAPFFEKDKRTILSKENNSFSSKELKMNYLKNIKTENQIILIDDDNEILRFVFENVKDIILFQDSELVD